MALIRSAAYTVSGAANQNVLTVAGINAATLGTVRPGMEIYLGSYLRPTGDAYIVTAVDTAALTITIDGTLAAAATNASFVIDKGTTDGSTLGNVLDDLAKITSAIGGFFSSLPGASSAMYLINKLTTGAISRLTWQVNKVDQFALEQRTGTAAEEWAIRATSDGGATFVDALVVDRTTGSVRFNFSATQVASAATVDLGAQPFTKIDITGTTAITSFGAGAHKFRLLKFLGALTLTNGASLALPGGANIVTAAGDTAIATSDGSGNWTVRHYQRASAAGARADIGAYGSGDSPTFSNVVTPGSTTAAPVFGYPNANGPALIFNGSATASAGSLDLYTNGVKRLGFKGNGDIELGQDNNTALGSTSKRLYGIWSGLSFFNSLNVGGGSAISGLATFGSGSGNAAVAVNGGGSGTNSGSALQFYNGGGLIGGIGGVSATIGGGYDSNMMIYSASAIRMGAGGSNWFFQATGHLTPALDAGQDIATSANRIRNLYIANNPTVGSDQKLKTKGKALPDNLLAAAREFEIVLFRYLKEKQEKFERDGIDSRKNIGVIAQQILAACERHGIDGFRHGFVGRDQDQIKRVTMVKSRRGKTVQREVFDLVREGDVMVRRSRMVDEPVMLTLPVLDEQQRPITELRDGVDVPLTHQVQDEEECEVEHREMVPAVNDNGEPIYTLIVRYEQILLVIAQAERQRADGLEARIADLEARRAA